MQQIHNSNMQKKFQSDVADFKLEQMRYAAKFFANSLVAFFSTVLSVVLK